MTYFNNPRTEEELQEQFRKLLIKHDYRNPANAKLISAIRAEYEEYAMQIKRANGYLPFEEKVANVVGMVKGKVKDYIDEEKMEQQRERQRITTLKNHKYTKQEFTDLLNQEKRCIEQIIISATKDPKAQKDQSPYRMLRSSIAFSDTYDDLYLSFTERVENQTVAGGKQYHNLREAIEYAAESLSPNKRQYEELMAKVETMMGKHFYQSFLKYEEMYVDPIIIQEYIKTSHKISDRKESKSSGKHIFLKLAILAGIVFIISFNIAEYLTGYDINNGTESSLTPIFVILTLISGAGFALASLMGLWGFFVVKPLEKQKRRARTHNSAVASESALKGLAQIIRMFLH